MSDASSSCPKCQATLPPGSAFCSKCGTSVAAFRQPPPAAPTAPEAEQELWRGRFSAKAQAHWWFLWSLEVVGLFYLWFAHVTPEVRGQAVARYVFAAAALLPAAWILWNLLVSKLTVRYRVTTHRLFKDSGLLSRHLEEVELLRVDDVSVRQNILQRIFNTGVVIVIAPSDATEPRIELQGIENPIEVKELIRNQVRKRRERSLHVESL